MFQIHFRECEVFFSSKDILIFKQRHAKNIERSSVWLMEFKQFYIKMIRTVIKFLKTVNSEDRQHTKYIIKIWINLNKWKHWFATSIFMLAISHKNSNQRLKNTSTLLSGRKNRPFFLPHGKRKKVFKMTGILYRWHKQQSVSYVHHNPLVSLSFISVDFQVQEKCNKSVYEKHIVRGSEWKISCWTLHTCMSLSVSKIISYDTYDI